MKNVFSLLVLFMCISVAYAQSSKPGNDASPNDGSGFTSGSKAAWDLQFNHTGIPSSGSAGVVSDGDYFYLAQWNGSMIWKLDTTGALVDSFSITGVTGLRDMVYDGNYFYGGAAGSTIYEMDFSTQTLISTINSPAVDVRHINYDASADGGNGAFWVGDWSTDFSLVSRNGLELQNISSASHGQTSTYGSAYDTITPGGPYIWTINAASGSDCKITQIDVNSGTPTGLVKVLTNDIAAPGQIGGGLFIAHDIVQGTFTLGGAIQNVAIFGYDLASVAPKDYDLALSSIDIPTMVPSGQDFDIEGEIINMGTQTITSFDLSYSINNGTPVTENITGVSLDMYDNYNFTHSTPWVPADGNQTVKVWVSNPNGNVDENPGNDTLVATTISYDPTGVVQRWPLHEGFTSSTCGPCNAGNASLKTVFDNNPNKWVCIKYQMSWPGSGDPYYTDEGGARRTFYGITGVPNLQVQGGHIFSGNSGNYTATLLNEAYNDPAFVELGADLTIDEGKQEVYLGVYINNNIDLPPATRLYAAIVEKETTQNVGTNGETLFDWVMKKMLPAAHGTIVGPLTQGSSTSEYFTYTFNGNYRLPASANDPIDHSVEHSVEDFQDLIAVVWLQNTQTKEVYQAVYSSVKTGVTREEAESISAQIYPNPAKHHVHVKLNNEIQGPVKMTLFSADGKTSIVNTQAFSHNNGKEKLDISSLAPGIYFIRLETEQGNTYTHPFMIK